MEKLDNDRDFANLRHALSLIGKRIVPGFLFYNHREVFLKWQWNSCRQTALFVAWYLTNIVFKGKRDVALYEANFTDPYLGDAVHAFCWVKPSEEDKYGLLIDVSRVSYPVLVERMTEIRDPSTLLSNRMGYEIKMTDLVEIGWESLLDTPEYFTHVPYRDFCEMIYKLYRDST